MPYTADDAVVQPAPPTIGRIVHYRLSGYDAEAINRRRDDYTATLQSGGAAAAGYVAHVGNRVTAGETYPAMVVRAWGQAVNLQVLLDGTDTYWATSRLEGNGESQWSWPPRA